MTVIQLAKAIGEIDDYYIELPLGCEKKERIRHFLKIGVMTAAGIAIVCLGLFYYVFLQKEKGVEEPNKAILFEEIGWREREIFGQYENASLNEKEYISYCENNVYLLLDESVLGDEIGEIILYGYQKMNDGKVPVRLEKKGRCYEIKGVSKEVAIAVSFDENEYCVYVCKEYEKEWREAVGRGLSISD